MRDTEGNNIASPIVETDTLWSYELGAKGRTAGGQLGYELTGWYLNWKNLQARVYVNGVQTGGNADAVEDGSNHRGQFRLHCRTLNSETRAGKSCASSNSQRQQNEYRRGSSSNVPT